MVRLALALLLLAPVLLAPAFANADLLKDLARNAEIIDVQLSPTGEYLGVLREDDDKRTAVFFSFPAMKPLSVMEFPGRNEVGQFWSSPIKDGDIFDRDAILFHIVLLAKDEEGFRALKKRLGQDIAMVAEV